MENSGNNHLKKNQYKYTNVSAKKLSTSYTREPCTPGPLREINSLGSLSFDSNISTTEPHDTVMARKNRKEILTRKRRNINPISESANISDYIIEGSVPQGTVMQVSNCCNKQSRVANGKENYNPQLIPIYVNPNTQRRLFQTNNVFVQQTSTPSTVQTGNSMIGTPNIYREARQMRRDIMVDKRNRLLNQTTCTPAKMLTSQLSGSSSSNILDSNPVSLKSTLISNRGTNMQSGVSTNKRGKNCRRLKEPVQPIPFNISLDTPSQLSFDETRGISSEYEDDGDPTYKCAACGAMLWYQESLRGHSTKGIAGSFSMCCMKGKVLLPSWGEQPPKLLLDLYTYNHPLSKHFIENIRQYNMIFSFTSMGGKIDRSVNNGRGPYTYRIRGQNCHKLGGLVPVNGSSPKFSQLYIYDTANEAANRKKAIGSTSNQSSNNEEGLNSDLINQIMHMLDQCNKLVKIYRMARDRYEANPPEEFKIKLIGRRPTDGRTYNLPTVDEVAALIVGDIDISFDERDIVIESHSKVLSRISELHPQYLALQYPLILAYAQDGYTTDIFHRDVDGSTSRKKKRVTMREWFAYRIQERTEVHSLLHMSKKLFQQFLVDAYTAIEAERISYIRRNQNILRCDSLSNLTDNSNSGNNNTSMLGNRYKLPSSFTGSARYMVENYRDAMALCRAFGYPDLFITFTCNPKWPEIRRILKNTTFNAEDKPTYIARIFKIKLDRLMHDVKVNKIFGKVVADVYTVEFQKRGLPHAHICLFLHEKDKMPNPEDVDSYICSEIPDKNTDPDLYKLVSDLMIHGPCGQMNPNCPCTDEDKNCTKRFPKPFSDETRVDTEGYPIYRRRQDGRTVTKLGHDLDNRYVVPYTPYLLKRYQAHLNVEWCNQVGSIRYLFKYINKGNDRVTAGVCDSETDEIKDYYDCRYVSACEAVWRILSFDIHNRNPAVMRLPFHLQGSQPVVFDEEELLENVINKPSVNTSMFLEWMNMNKHSGEARELTYVEFPSKFCWQKMDRVWTRRKRGGGSVGRIHHVSPQAGELFYLRILLCKVRGPTSYEEIRTVNGKVCNTFKEACYEMGLLDDDQEYIDGIKEASTWSSGHQIRLLFAQLLLSNSLSRPEIVYQKTFSHLSADLLQNERRMLAISGLEVDREMLENCTLYEIEKILQKNSSTLKAYGSMPFPVAGFVGMPQNSLITDELSYDRRMLTDEHASLYPKLTDEQKNAYEAIVSAVNDNRGGVFFLYGYGGTGKTFVWKTLSAFIRSQGHIVLNVASSGVAALLLSGGRTAHSRFAIPLDPTDESFCRMTPNSKLAELIRHTKLIIWDEAPMVDRRVVETLDRSLRDICRPINSKSMETPFGGKVIVFGGDFRQVLPVVHKGKRADTVAASLNSSYIWDHVTVLKLTINMRLSGGIGNDSSDDTKAFGDWILSIGNGTMGEPNDGEVEVTMPSDILINNVEDPIGTLISCIYPNFIQNLGNPSYYQERAILAPTHDVVNTINDHMMTFLEGEEQIFLSSDTICQSEMDANFNNELYTTEFLNSIQVGGLPKHRLVLKVGVPVMLLRNVDITSGLCNGTRLQVTKLTDKMIQAKILTGTHVGTLTCVPRMLIVPKDKRIPFRFQRRQYPLSVCFAMTINKSQGQSLSHVGLFLQRPVFSHGQLYVALSRVKSKSGLKVLILNKDKSLGKSTKNVVYKEVLQYL